MRNSNAIELYETEKVSPCVRHEKFRRHDSKLQSGTMDRDQFAEAPPPPPGGNDEVALTQPSDR